MNVIEVKNKRIVITGFLNGMNRNEAIAIIEEKGGIYQASVSNKTDILLQGNFQLDMFNLEKKSIKRLKAEELLANGKNIKIISGECFFSQFENRFVKKY